MSADVDELGLPQSTCRHCRRGIYRNRGAGLWLHINTGHAECRWLAEPVDDEDQDDHAGECGELDAGELELPPDRHYWCHAPAGHEPPHRLGH